MRCMIYAIFVHDISMQFIKMSNKLPNCEYKSLRAIDIPTEQQQRYEKKNHSQWNRGKWLKLSNFH